MRKTRWALVGVAHILRSGGARSSSKWLALLDMWRAGAPAHGVRLYVDNAIILISLDARCAYYAVPLSLLPMLPVVGHPPRMPGARISLPCSQATSLLVDWSAHNACRSDPPPLLESDELPDLFWEQHEGDEGKHDDGDMEAKEQEGKRAALKSKQRPPVGGTQSREEQTKSSWEAPRATGNAPEPLAVRAVAPSDATGLIT